MKAALLSLSLLAVCTTQGLSQATLKNGSPSTESN